MNRTSSMHVAAKDEQLDAELDDLLGDGGDPPSDQDGTVILSAVATGGALACAEGADNVCIAGTLFEQAALNGMDTHQLAQLLARVTGQRDPSGKPLPYVAIRHKVREINLALDRQGLLAPRFRSSRPIAQSKRTSSGWAVTDEDALIGLDRKLADLQWLWCRGYRPVIDDARYANLLTEETFDELAATAFLKEKWTSDKRAEMMSLSPLEQIALGMLQTKAVGDHCRMVESRVRGIRTRLRAAKTVKRVRLQEADAEDFVRLWVAQQLVHALPDPTQEDIAQVHAWQCGAEPLAVSTISKKLAKLDAWLSCASGS